MLEGFHRFATSNRWIWSALGVLILWIVLGNVTSRFSLSSLSGVATSASFLAILSIGQMFVVTTGKGNIDLSIPSVLTLSAYVTVILTRGGDFGLLATIPAILVVALVTAALNSFLVLVVRIPAMISTLASGYIIATGTLIANRSVKGFGTDPVLGYLATGKLMGVPVIFIVALGVMGGAAWLLNRSAYGAQLSAVGQNERAAMLAGINVPRTIGLAFVLSSLLAAFAGALLSAYVGGAFLEMGSPYLLQSVGAVVLGGTLISGGSSTALGTLFGSLLLILIVTTMQIAGLPPGTQDIVQGCVIILVLALSGTKAVRRRRRSQRPSTLSANPA